MGLLVCADVVLSDGHPLPDRHDGGVTRALVAQLAFTFAFVGLVVAAQSAGAFALAAFAGLVGGSGSLALERRLGRARGAVRDPVGRVASFVGLCLGVQLFAPAAWCVLALLLKRN
jgi:hypothetical protein